MPGTFQHAVIIVIDTLRADAIEAAHTPHLDAIASSGSQVKRAWASGTWTAPSIVSLFTGSPIRAHGWDLPAGHIGRYPRLPALPTLAETLQAAGFTTTALVTNPYLTQELGFNRGFDQYLRTTDTAMPGSLERLIEGQTKTAQRHFLYLHLMGPHSPLKPSPEARLRHGLSDTWFSGRQGLQIGAAKRNTKAGVRSAYKAAYHAVLEDTDARLGTLIETLTALGPDTLLIVTSDHGELLGEHNIVGHGRHLWEPLTQVPLLVRNLDGMPSQLRTDALADLTTRLLDVQATWPSTVAGSQTLVSQREGAVAIRTDGPSKWLWNAQGAYHYNLAQDPGEHTPSSMDQAGIAAKERFFAAHPQAAALPLETHLPEETLEELKVLGYAD